MSKSSKRETVAAPAITETTERGRGQPTKYRPEYCEQVIAWGKEGKSIAQMCAELGVCYNTMTGAWTKANPEFAVAMDLWYVHALAWWEAKGQDNLTTREFQSHLYLRSMSARFPQHWREITRSELTGADGTPLDGRPDLSGLSEQELVLLASIRKKIGGNDVEEPVRH